MAGRLERQPQRHEDSRCESGPTQPSRDPAQVDSVTEDDAGPADDKQFRGQSQPCRGGDAEMGIQCDVAADVEHHGKSVTRHQRADERLAHERSPEHVSERRHRRRAGEDPQERRSIVVTGSETGWSESDPRTRR